jgi:hypothetical protein
MIDYATEAAGFVDMALHKWEKGVAEKDIDLGLKVAQVYALLSIAQEISRSSEFSLHR